MNLLNHKHDVWLTNPISLQLAPLDANIAVQAFHPEQASIFLTALIDGTVTAYHRYPLTKTSAGSISTIGCFPRLFSTPIVGAAFLPGYLTRAVCVASNGRCKLVDFAEGGKLLRSWRVRGPVTSLKVLTETMDPGNGHPLEPIIILQISRDDASIAQYDSIGLYIGEKGGRVKTACSTPLEEELARNNTSLYHEYHKSTTARVSRSLWSKATLKRKSLDSFGLDGTVKRMKVSTNSQEMIPPVTVADINLFSPDHVSPGKPWTRPRICSKTFTNPHEEDLLASESSVTPSIEEESHTSFSSDLVSTSQLSLDQSNAQRRESTISNGRVTVLSMNSLPMPTIAQPIRYRRSSERSSLTISSTSLTTASCPSQWTSSTDTIMLKDSDSHRSNTQTLQTACRGAVLGYRSRDTGDNLHSATSNDLSLTAQASPVSPGHVKRIKRKPSLAAELAPGKADSPEGPVSVHRFFPRKSSCAPLNEVSGNGSAAHCCDNIRQEMQDLKMEVRALRHLVEDMAISSSSRKQ